MKIEKIGYFLCTKNAIHSRICLAIGPFCIALSDARSNKLFPGTYTILR